MKTVITHFKISHVLLVSLGLSSIPGVFADDTDRGRLPRPSQERGAYNNSINSITSQEFVNEATACGIKEIHCARIAIDRSSNPQVKGYAENIVRQHTEANRTLSALALKKGLTVPGTNSVETADLKRDSSVGKDRDQTVTDRDTGTADAPNSAPLSGTQPRQDDVNGSNGNRLGTEERGKLSPVDRDYRSRLQSVASSGFDRAFLQEMLTDHAQAIQRFDLAAEKLTDEDLRRFASETVVVLRAHHKEAQRLGQEHKLDLTKTDFRSSEENLPRELEKNR